MRTCPHLHWSIALGIAIRTLEGFCLILSPSQCPQSLSRVRTFAKFILPHS